MSQESARVHENSEPNESGSECESVVCKRSRNAISEVWTYFQRSKDKTRAKCLSCEKVYKTSGNTSNLLDHLKRTHPGYNRMSKPNKITSFFNASETYDSHSAQDEAFSAFVKLLDPRYMMPSRTKLQNVMCHELYDQSKANLKNILMKVDTCAISTDAWTSRANESYLTVTCHFIENCSLRSAVLSTYNLLESTNHSAANIAESLRIVLTEWGVLDKVLHVVTDNASSMIKACELLQKRHLPCFTHTLNLVVQDVLAFEKVKNVITKCKKVVTYFKSSSIAYAKFKNAQGTGKNPKSTRTLSADEIELLEELVELLALFDDATIQVSASNSVTISLIIPIICILFQTLNETHNKLKTNEGLAIFNILIERLQIRLVPYENRTTPKMSTLLDPRFKKEEFRNHIIAEQAALALENELSNMLKTLSPVVTDLPTHTVTSPESSTQQPKIAPLFMFLNDKVAGKRKSTRADAIIMLRQYFENQNLPHDFDPFEYWKTNTDMKVLTQCALRYLCTPATSTEPERVFSKS
ncbi:zinc finger BED domain-containing protein 1-like [Rhagoletis pomonella]|uniref:zinc finger BED domain-containing protein 1-like n=1 Tax=Rhagoletis pomonella TaxID=28610 RepID=UPI0017813921|nr:zinc finger BED domain-containing protein 1-like [Rhagoletis pomonella]